MVDLESIKAYYWDTGEEEWVQIMNISSLHVPEMQKRMDAPGSAILGIDDFEGSLFSTWEALDYVKIKITDSSGNALFRGFLRGKTFKEKGVILNIVGFSILLDGTPFNHDFIYHEGLVKDVPGVGSGKAASYDISGDVTSPHGICWNGTNYFVTSTTDRKVYEYNASFVLQASHDVSANMTNPGGIMWDGTYFLIFDSADTKIYKYSDAFVYQEKSSAIGIQFFGMEFADGTYYAIEGYDTLYYSSTWNFSSYETIDLSGISTHIADICIKDNIFYLLDYDATEIIKVYNNVEVESGTLPAANNLPISFCHDGNYFHVLDFTDEYIYVYIGLNIPYSDNYSLDLKQDDEDAGYPDFTWTSDSLTNKRDLGLLLAYNPNALNVETWTVTGVVLANEEGSFGTIAGMATDWDLDVYYAYATPSSFFTITLTVEGDGIPVANLVNRIVVTFRYALRVEPLPIGTSAIKVSSNLKIYNGTWHQLKHIEVVQNNYFAPAGVSMIEESWEITGDSLEDYLELNELETEYVSLKSLAIWGAYWEAGGVGGGIPLAGTSIDYISVAVYYSTNPYTPIMTKIIDNGASWIVSNDVDFSATGVNDDDKFQIGESTNGVLNVISGDIGISIINRSIATFSKYLARKFSGTNCSEALRVACQLEGAHWTEDHENEALIVAKESDFEDTGIDLTVANFDRDWNFEDECNYYKGVWIKGNASLNREYKTPSEDQTDSLMWKQINDDTLMTEADCKEVHDAIWAELKDKRPSLKIGIMDTDESYSNVQAMQTFDLTMARPTIAQATYPIRRMDNRRMGEHVEYTFYLGLGSTPEEEKRSNLDRQLSYSISKSFTDRYANTPYGGGATLTPENISGLDTYVGVLIAAASINNIVEDTTPQLGGDLDLNTHSIDFPTTANVSDCLDEDNMASNSATKLATQQSIKAYTDNTIESQRQSKKRTCEIQLWIDTASGADYEVGCIRLDAVNDRFEASFLVKDDVDDSKDLVFTFMARCDTDDANVAFLRHIAANTDEESHTWNVESANAINWDFDKSAAWDWAFQTVTIAAANYSIGDIIYMLLTLNEAARTVHIYACTLTYYIT